MDINPDVININYTSFAKKEGYKPPTTAFFGTSTQNKKSKYVPGGDWAQEDAPKTTINSEHLPEINDFTNKTSDQTAPKPKSKFEFIKDKKEKPKNDSKSLNSVGVLDFADVRTDQ